MEALRNSESDITEANAEIQYLKGNHIKPRELMEFSERDLCIVKCLAEHIDRTSRVRTEKQLILATRHIRGLVKPL